jgi:hypothetical protein
MRMSTSYKHTRSQNEGTSELLLHSNFSCDLCAMRVTLWIEILCFFQSTCWWTLASILSYFNNKVNGRL